jgi:hypothetical protein
MGTHVNGAASEQLTGACGGEQPDRHEQQEQQLRNDIYDVIINFVYNNRLRRRRRAVPNAVDLPRPIPPSRHGRWAYSLDENFMDAHHMSVVYGQMSQVLSDLPHFAEFEVQVRINVSIQERAKCACRYKRARM